MKRKNLYRIWLGLLGIFILMGIYTTFKLYTEGGGEIFHTNDNIPWTLLIATYIFFVLTSTGATLVASLSTVFGFKQYEPLVKRSIFIGIITLMAGFLAMGLELGNPINMIYYFITPGFTSPIWWMGVFYLGLLIVLIYKFWLLHTSRGNEKQHKVLSIFAVVLEIAALSTLGAVFGLIEARPTFFGEYIQMYFLFTAILSGISAIFFFSLITYKLNYGKIPQKFKPMYENLSRIFGVVIGVTLLLSVWHTVTGLYANRPEFDVLHFMLNSVPYRIEIFIGLMLPLAIMLIPDLRKSFYGKFTASVLVFIGLGIGRMDMVMLGQLQPIIPKLSSEGTNIVSYFPTFWEWMIAMFSFSLMLLLYTLGERYLKLETHKTS